jgi:Ca2+-binding RTX toxin-like protein
MTDTNYNLYDQISGFYNENQQYDFSFSLNDRSNYSQMAGATQQFARSIGLQYDNWSPPNSNLPPELNYPTNTSYEDQLANANSDDQPYLAPDAYYHGATVRLFAFKAMTEGRPWEIGRIYYASLGHELEGGTDPKWWADHNMDYFNNKDQLFKGIQDYFEYAQRNSPGSSDPITFKEMVNEIATRVKDDVDNGTLITKPWEAFYSNDPSQQKVATEMLFAKHVQEPLFQLNPNNATPYSFVDWKTAGVHTNNHIINTVGAKMAVATGDSGSPNLSKIPVDPKASGRLRKPNPKKAKAPASKGHAKKLSAEDKRLLDFLKKYSHLPPWALSLSLSYAGFSHIELVSLSNKVRTDPGIITWTGFPDVVTNATGVISDPSGKVLAKPNPPLVFDMDNDGVETISLENSKAFFDFDGNGFAQRTSWVSRDDALLAIDRDLSGQIEDVNELFGFLDKTGFEELGELDTNGDNLIDINDEEFGQLRVWQDSDEDGETDVGELETLAERGIQSISLKTKIEDFAINDNPISESAVFTKSDNSTSTIYDVFFKASFSYTQTHDDFNISLDLILSPWLRGQGLVKDLLVEATTNDNLKTLVQELTNESDIFNIYNRMDELLGEWSGVGTIGQSTLTVCDPGIAAFIDKFLNLGLEENQDFANENIDTYNDSYLLLKEKLFVDFISQTAVGTALGITYNFFEDKYVINDNVFYPSIVENLTNSESSFASFLLTKVLAQNSQLNLTKLSDSIIQHGFGSVLLDYLKESISWVAPDIDGLVTGDTANNLLFSNIEDVTIQGGAGNDWLVSAAGNNTLQGGTGNDTYVLSDLNNPDIIDDFEGSEDTLILGAGISKDNLVLSQSGNDLVLTALGQTLGTIKNWYITPSIETFRFHDGTSLNSTEISSMQSTLTGTSSGETLTGNNFTNTLNADSGNDVVYGYAGNDTIDGGSGSDTLLGGYGDDTYTVDSINDVVTEIIVQGTDTIQSSVNWTLGDNIENLTLTGSATNGTGNMLDNAITGNSSANSLTGGLGDDTLDGGAGDDTLIGGLDSDTFVIDSVSDVITENADEGTGDTVQSSISYTLGSHLENLTLTGSNAINGTGNALDNILTGNSNTNTLIGGDGDDTYIVQNTADVVVENASEGTDAIESSVSFTLSSHVENLVLTGPSSISATGNTLNNTLTGNSANNTLTGGSGDDTYVVQNSGDMVVENANEGTDTVQSSVSYTLSSNVEALTLTGIDSTTGTGNTLANEIQGNLGDNTLDGGTGADTLMGNEGDDTYIVDDANDVITEFEGDGTDTAESSVSYTLSEDIENLTLTGSGNNTATGNSLNNIITGNSGTNTLTGGLGDDTYIVQNSGDTVVENTDEGTDTVDSSVDYTLSNYIENLTLTGSGNITATGNALNNIITGNSGTNTLTGGLGDDTYIVQNSGDAVVENAAEGTDTVQSNLSYTLSQYVENLTLTGTSAISATGNTENNSLIGNTANNTLDGSSGTDTMAGGDGDDTYTVDNTGDLINENASEGIDSVQSSVSYTLKDYVENLTLTGMTATQGIGSVYDNALIGNTLNNSFEGRDGNDTLDGGTGTDTLKGGAGDDTFLVDDAGDVVAESINEGTDTIQTALSYTLGSNIENLTLTGSSNLTGTGNALNNVLTSNTGINTLVGGLGDDTYVLENSSDVVTENALEGTDTVKAKFTYTLGDNFENLVLTGTSAIHGTGNSANNSLTGNTAANSLIYVQELETTPLMVEKEQIR